MVQQKGINLENVKMRNKSAILKLINRNGAMSRKDIAKEIGLTAATVTVLCTEMMEENILFEKGEVQEERRAGRKKILVDINYDYKSIIAVTISSKTTTICICDLKGNLINKKKIATNASCEPELFLKTIETESKILLWENEKSPKDILGMGICVPGIVNRKKGTSVHAYGIWDTEIEIKKIMEQYMNCPVIVENNIKAFAEGELLYGAGKTGDNLLFVKWGPGVGSAIVIGNQLYEGKNHKSAEIGHYIIEPNGEPCRCGRQGCLETKVSTYAIVKQIRELYSEESTPNLYKWSKGNINLVTEEAFTEWACKENDMDLSDSTIIEVLNQIIERMARTIVNMTTILAPDHTIIYGFMLENKDIQKTFLDYCIKYDNSYANDYIKQSTLSHKRHYIGPTAIVARSLFFEP